MPGIDQLLRELDQRSSRPLAIFLGAGASKTFGYPLTRDLMLKIFQGLMSNTLLLKNSVSPDLQSGDPRGELLQFLTELLPGERYSEEKVPMVTAVLSLLDFSLATGQALLPRRTLDATRRARQLLERAVLEVIPDGDKFADQEQKRFDRFRKWLKTLAARRPRGGLAIITTNYDRISDVVAMSLANVKWKAPFRGLPHFRVWSLTDLARKVDFGFRWVRSDRKKEEFVSRPAQPRIALYKLHGSTNWLRCPLCENLYIIPNGATTWMTGGKKGSWWNQCHCSDTRLEAQIISPSFIREMREPNLVAVWKSTLDFLREADQWVMIGYSFPDEDVGIRALFTRALGSKRELPRIGVVQLNEDARINYESFFPDGSVHYVTGGLPLLLDRWHEAGHL